MGDERRHVYATADRRNSSLIVATTSRDAFVSCRQVNRSTSKSRILSRAQSWAVLWWLRTASLPQASRHPHSFIAQAEVTDRVDTAMNAVNPAGFEADRDSA